MSSSEQLLRKGGVGVLATDTLYGVVGQALKPQTVERIYQIKGRSPTKPLIILISSTEQLRTFGVNIGSTLKKRLDEFWPGPTSVILACDNDQFSYLHRGTKTLAFRLPAKESLKRLIEKTGPLVAPSANPEGKVPAKTIEQAKLYFDEKVDFYEKGEVTTSPSKLLEIKNNQIIVHRS